MRADRRPRNGEGDKRVDQRPRNGEADRRTERSYRNGEADRRTERSYRNGEADRQTERSSGITMRGGAEETEKSLKIWHFSSPKHLKFRIKRIIIEKVKKEGSFPLSPRTR